MAIERLITTASLTLLVLAAALPQAARAVEYGRVLTEKSQVDFAFRQMGVSVDGRFRRFAVQMAFDPSRPQDARARIEVQLAGIDAGSDDANEEVKSKNWFNVQQFPVATFVSSAVKSLGGNRYEATGKMTIKGKSQDVVVPFTYRPDDANGLFEGSFAIKRLAYDVGSGPWGDTDTVADEVHIKFRILVAAGAASGK